VAYDLGGMSGAREFLEASGIKLSHVREKLDRLLAVPDARDRDVLEARLLARDLEARVLILQSQGQSPRPPEVAKVIREVVSLEKLVDHLCASSGHS